MRVTPGGLGLPCKELPPRVFERGGRGCLNAGLYSESWPPDASLWPMGTNSARGQLLPRPPCVCEAVLSASVQTSCNWTLDFAVSSKRRAQPYSPEPGVSWGLSVFF